MGSIRTRSPILLAATPAPTAAIWPQPSAPWMRGNRKGAPVQPPSASGGGAPVAGAAVACSAAREYQPMRVLMSVLLTAAAAMRTSTSPKPGIGTGTVRSSSCPKSPWPLSTTASIVPGGLRPVAAALTPASLPLGFAISLVRDVVVIALIGAENVPLDPKARRTIERSGGDGDLLPAVGAPEQRRAALGAETPLGLGRGAVPPQWRLADQPEIPPLRVGRGHEVAGLLAALRAVAGDDITERSVHFIDALTAQAAATKRGQVHDAPPARRRAPRDRTAGARLPANSQASCSIIVAPS